MMNSRRLSIQPITGTLVVDTYEANEKELIWRGAVSGTVALHTIGRTRVHAAILGAPAAIGFLGLQMDRSAWSREPMERFKGIEIDEQQARTNIEPIDCPVLILVGTKDPLIHVDYLLHDQLEKQGKQVRMEVYENGYHDFCMGPQGHPEREEPLLDATLEALDLSIQFSKTAE